MPRFASIWLPYWPTDRRKPGLPSPGVLAAAGQGGLVLSAVDAKAWAAGLRPGMTLADARALVPALRAETADAAADAAALRRLGEWCARFSPWTAVDGDDGLCLDISGVAHLFGGERALSATISGRLAGLGLHASIAIADSPAAAWALAHYGDASAPVIAPVIIAPVGGNAAALAPLPVAGLRIGAEDQAALARLGLRRIGDLYALARAALGRRFGPLLLRRLDQALGLAAEPLAPLLPAAPWRARMGFAEPIGRREDIDEACRRLIGALCQRLEREQRGLRRLEAAFYRADGTAQRLGVGTAEPSRTPAHLMRLLATVLDGVEPGFGIDEIILSATATGRLAPAARTLDPAAPEAGASAELIDRLAARLGPHSVLRLAAADSHVPERAAVLAPALAGPRPGDGAWNADGRAPMRLLPCPEPVEVAAADDIPAPAAFRWRRVTHVVARAEGPERIAPEWWRDGAAPARDYWRVEDEHGRRFWLYRVPGGAGPSWYVHGLLA